jgi:hypothetical protein
MKTGNASLPLHGGKCPAWLFTHMKALSAAIIEVIIEDQGTAEVLRRLSDPYWFQALGCVVGFDWHSSGVTTTVCGAVKEGLAGIAPQAGLYFAGGKGKASRQTPAEIISVLERYPVAAEAQELIYASKMAAKVDNTAVQDGFQLYHHFFAFNAAGEWAIVQQGMNEDLKQARRYHWLSSKLTNFTEEPQAAICCDKVAATLNLVSRENGEIRDLSSKIACRQPARIIGEIKQMEGIPPTLDLPRRHSIPRSSYLNKALNAAYAEQPRNFEQLLALPGVGPGTLRALCLVAEVAYGAKPSFTDPVRYSFAHGGKDGFPFPVNEKDIENSYTTLKRALRKARAGRKEQLDALKNLARWHSQALTIKAGPPPSGHDHLPGQDRKRELGNRSSRETLFQPGLF